MALELNGIAAWIYSKLAGSSIVTNFVGLHPTEKIPNIYETVGIEGATYPMVIFKRLTGRNVNGTAGRRVFDSAFYEIVVIDENQGSYAGVEPVANELDALMYQAQDTLDPLVAGCTTVASVQRVENDDGKRRNVEGVEVQIMAYYQSG